MGSFDNHTAAGNVLTIANTGNKPLTPDIRMVGIGRSRSYRPTIPAGQSHDVLVQWSLSSYVYSLVYGKPIEGNVLNVGANCGDTAAVNADGRTTTEVAITAIWNYPRCLPGIIFEHPSTYINQRIRQIEMTYDPTTKKASRTMNYRLINKGKESLRMTLFQPPHTLHVANHPDTGLSLDGINASRFTIATRINGGTSEPTIADRELSTGQEMEAVFAINADMSGLAPGVHGTQLTFFSFESILPANDVCRPRDPITRDPNNPIATSVYFYVRGALYTHPTQGE